MYLKNYLKANIYKPIKTTLYEASCIKFFCNLIRQNDCCTFHMVNLIGEFSGYQVINIIVFYKLTIDTATFSRGKVIKYFS